MDADDYAVIPMSVFLQIEGARFSQTINVRNPGDEAAFARAQDEVRQILRARRHVAPAQADDFFIGTKDAYIALWAQISGAFFAVFILVRYLNKLSSSFAAPEPTAPQAPTTKECPFCLSIVSLKATRCPQCTSQLSGAAAQ